MRFTLCGNSQTEKLRCTHGLIGVRVLRLQGRNLREYCVHMLSRGTVNEFAFLVVLVACSCSSPAATEDWSVKVNFGAFPFLHMSSSIHTTFPFPFLHMTITCFLHISSCNPPAYLLHNCGNLQGIFVVILHKIK